MKSLDELQALCEKAMRQDKLDVLKYSPEEAAAEMYRAAMAGGDLLKAARETLPALIAIARAIDNYQEGHFEWKDVLQARADLESNERTPEEK